MDRKATKGRNTYRRRELSIKWVLREVVRPTDAYESLAPVRGPADAFAYLRPWCREPLEIAVVLLFDVRMRVMGHRIISTGSLSSAVVSPRVLMQAVLLSGAAAFILAHNHPSGDSTPSTEDIEMTQKIKKLAEALELAMLDHLILVCDQQGRDTFVSLKESGSL